MRIAYLSTDFGVPVLGTKGASVHVRRMIGALDDHLEQDSRGVQFSGVFDAKGKRLAGNVAALPDGLDIGAPARSVPLQLVAVAFVVYLGLKIGREPVAIATGIIGLVVGGWRLAIARAHADPLALDDARLARARRLLEANSAVAGAMWVVATFGIYAYLQGPDATAYVVIACGSVSVAAFFMSFVGRSFLLLAIPQIGAVAPAVAVKPETFDVLDSGGQRLNEGQTPFQAFQLARQHPGSVAVPSSDEVLAL